MPKSDQFPTDLDQFPTDELESVMDSISRELSRRRAVREIPEQVLQLNLAYLEADERPSGSPWRQPTGAHDSYPKGYEVAYKDAVWMSLLDGNVWEPGVSGWREKGTGKYPAWVQPTGAHDAYNVGDKVSFEGGCYESAQDSNTWSPRDYAAAWLTIACT